MFPNYSALFGYAPGRMAPLSHAGYYGSPSMAHVASMVFIMIERGACAMCGRRGCNVCLYGMVSTFYCVM
jgi:hypothetical protein